MYGIREIDNLEGNSTYRAERAIWEEFNRQLNDNEDKL